MATDMNGRMEWSIDMQEQHALSYYREYWSDTQKITEVDKLGKSSDDMKHLDFSGIDKIIHTKSGTYHVAQRFRQMRNTKEGLKEPDFSLRYETYSDRKTEYQKLKEAHNGVASIPQVYGFGIAPHGREVARQNGFKQFFLIDVQTFLTKHLSNGEIEILDKVPNGDGSVGAYFDLCRIRDSGCVLHEWGETDSTKQEGLESFTE